MDSIYLITIQFVKQKIAQKLKWKDSLWYFSLMYFAWRLLWDPSGSLARVSYKSLFQQSASYKNCTQHKIAGGLHDIVVVSTNCITSNVLSFLLHNKWTALWLRGRNAKQETACSNMTRMEKRTLMFIEHSCFQFLESHGSTVLPVPD
jgi:hypothetical protein